MLSAVPKLNVDPIMTKVIEKNRIPIKNVYCFWRLYKEDLKKK